GGQVFLLEQGSAGRLPWVTSLDVRIGLNYRLGSSSVVTAAIEGFNLFNSQRPTGVNELYTPGFVTQILGAQQGSVPDQYWGLCIAPSPRRPAAAAATCLPGNGSLPRPRVDPTSPAGNAIRVGLPNLNGKLSSQLTNLSWGKPTSYQPVRQFR